MIIRSIQRQDNVAIKAIIQESLESHGLAVPGSAYFDPQLGDLHGFYESLPHAHYWVVELDNRVVGGVGIAPFGEEGTSVAELQKLYLHPSAQGMGLSHVLMAEALTFATTHFQQCYLETMHSLEAACALYEKYGFIILPEPLAGSEHSAMDAWYLKELQR
ncbi:MAG: GNAT family N-acetyltransferase [Corynebacterium sp.]|nr:GNAT family N-acetyltransferase [Corynebacterium sp.]